MTKKDYQLVAEAIHQAMSSYWYDVDGDEILPDKVVRDIVENLSDQFKIGNPNFNKEKFVAACGI